MSDNWIVQNLNSALSTWSEKMAELWTLLTENPATFKGGGIWRIMTNINDALTAIAYGLLVLFFAAGDPLSVINNLSTFIFSLIRAIGLILLGFGVVQVGLSLKSHDPSQRANGFLTLAGGVIITFAKEILDLIMA